MADVGPFFAIMHDCPGGCGKVIFFHEGKLIKGMPVKSENVMYPDGRIPKRGEIPHCQHCGLEINFATMKMKYIMRVGP